MKLKDIIKKKSEILADGHEIENEMIHGADINIVGHFNNAVSLNIWTGCCCLIPASNNTKNLGYIIRAIIELLDLTEEDGYTFNKIENIPIRIISDGWGSKVLGFGHFMKDQFVYTDDLLKITE